MTRSDSESADLTSRNIKTAVVTGGAARIGAAIVRDLARHDFAVAIHTNRGAEQAEALAAELIAAGGKASVVRGDLTVAGDCAGIMREAAAALGPIGLLINNASIFQDDAVESLDEEVFDRHFAIHVRAPSILTGAFAQQLPAAARGLVVNII